MDHASEAAERIYKKITHPYFRLAECDRGFREVFIAAVSDEIELARKSVLETVQSRLHHRLNAHLVGMKPDCDDSTVGFNDAQTIVSELLADLRVARLSAAQNTEAKK